MVSWFLGLVVCLMRLNVDRPFFNIQDVRVVNFCIKCSVVPSFCTLWLSYKFFKTFGSNIPSCVHHVHRYKALVSIWCHHSTKIVLKLVSGYSRNKWSPTYWLPKNCLTRWYYESFQRINFRFSSYRSVQWHGSRTPRRQWWCKISQFWDGCSCFRTVHVASRSVHLVLFSNLHVQMRPKFLFWFQELQWWDSKDIGYILLILLS